MIRKKDRHSLWVDVLKKYINTIDPASELLQVLDIAYSSPVLVYGESKPMYSLSSVGDEVFEVSMGWLRHCCPSSYAEACAAVLRGDLQIVESRALRRL